MLTGIELLKFSVWWTLQKQFKQQLHDQQEHKQRTEASSKSISLDANQVRGNPSDGLELTPRGQSQHELLTAGQKHASVHDRIRMPVTYDDLLGGEDPKDGLAWPKWTSVCYFGNIRRPFFCLRLRCWTLFLFYILLLWRRVFIYFLFFFFVWDEYKFFTYNASGVFTMPRCPLFVD